jgi:glycosyltransferase involved in cell wall biosynthesis
MRVAVVLISYNQEKYISEALDGIVNQSFQPDEVVIADDCSTDRTQSIIIEYVKTHNLEGKWTLLLNRENVGINRNLQNGIDHTTADIIVPMAGDDISLSNRCKVATKLFREYPDLNIVTTSAHIINSEGKYIGGIKYQNEIRNNIKKVIRAGMPNVFPVGQNWKRSLFDRFGKLPINVPNEDDQITFWGLISGGIFCSDINTIAYRVHSESASSWLRNDQSDCKYFSRFLSDMPIRQSHMDLWADSLKQVDVSDQAEINQLIQLKIEVYSFMGRIEEYGGLNRLIFLYTHRYVLCHREMYYLFFGKFGVLSWRWLKKILGR